MNMVMNNDGSGNILQTNSLLPPHEWSEEFRARLAEALHINKNTLRNHNSIGFFNVIVTNPPFGSKIPIKDKHILEQFALAHIWECDKKNRCVENDRPASVLCSSGNSIYWTLYTASCSRGPIGYCSSGFHPRFSRIGLYPRMVNSESPHCSKYWSARWYIPATQWNSTSVLIMQKKRKNRRMQRKERQNGWLQHLYGNSWKGWSRQTWKPSSNVIRKATKFLYRTPTVSLSSETGEGHRQFPMNRR